MTATGQVLKTRLLVSSLLFVFVVFVFVFFVFVSPEKDFKRRTGIKNKETQHEERCIKY